MFLRELLKLLSVTSSGSNITNIALVLGLTVVVVREIKLHDQIWHVDMPFLLSSAFLLWFLVRDGSVSIFEGLIFLGALVLFLVYSLRSDDGEEIIYKKRVSWKSYIWMLIGGVLVWLGAEYTIVAIINLSEIMGIDSSIIALSMVALGTSLPEVIVSLGAAKKGKTSIAVGNVLGSNIFNTFAVMGIPAFFGKLNIPESIFSLQPSVDDRHDHTFCGDDHFPKDHSLGRTHPFNFLCFLHGRTFS